MNKKKKIYQVPKCPICNEELFTIWETIYENYTFNQKTGRYDEEVMSEDMDIKCPECGANLGIIFKEGACNFQAKK